MEPLVPWGEGAAADAAGQLNILVVVDLQKDYCSDCQGLDAARNVDTGYGTPLQAVATAISELIAKVPFDGLMITQDVLPYGTRHLLS